MVVRRVLFGAFALLFVTVAPASADDTYNHVLGGERTPGSSTGGQAVSAAGQSGATSVGASSTSSDSGLLARTGSDYLVPMAEGAAVLIGAGSLLVLATRRRRSTSTASA